MRRRLGEPLRIAELAQLAAMSERTFMRRVQYRRRFSQAVQPE
jgi:transcriptional regulator GlxA family with amidase domain